MKNLILLLAIYIFSGVAYAQTDQIPQNITDAGVGLTKQAIDSNNAQIQALNAQIQALNAQIANEQGIANTYLAKVASEQSQITAIQATNIQLESSLTALATQTPPMQSALALCPSYCYGWNQSVLTTNVNWDQVALLRSQGTNWQDIQTSMTGINWQAVNAINGINWQSINQAGINWNDWPAQEASGVNWSQWILNGGI